MNSGKILIFIFFVLELYSKQQNLPNGFSNDVYINKIRTFHQTFCSCEILKIGMKFRRDVLGDYFPRHNKKQYLEQRFPRIKIKVGNREFMGEIKNAHIIFR